MADSWLAPVEALPQRTFVLAAGGAVAAPLLAALALVEPIWAFAALLPLVGAAALARHRARIAGLPLEVAALGLVGRVDGMKVFRFRARLGRGRAVARAVAEVRWRGPDGVEIPLSVEPGSYERVVGAWTICARDRGGKTGDAGELHVVVQADEGARTWQAAAQVPVAGLRRGRFAGAAVSGGCLVPGDWQAVVPEEA